MKINYLFTFLAITSICYSQNNRCGNFKNDSCVLPPTLIKQEVKLIEAVIKNKNQIQFIQHHQKNYLKIIVKDNLGFGQIGSLLLISNNKQYFTKEIKLEVIDKQSAYFLLEINSYYLITLKESGLTSIIFNEKVEFIIPKADSELIKKTASCFSELISK